MKKARSESRKKEFLVLVLEYVKYMNKGPEVFKLDGFLEFLQLRDAPFTQVNRLIVFTVCLCTYP